MTDETKIIASEGSTHWYDAVTGEPRYTIIGKNGKERNTTLRDARTMNLVPSVTGILKMAANPMLERWKRNQVLLSALTLPKVDGESEGDWLKRVEQDWQQQGRDAADRGTEIHASIEKGFALELVSEKDFPFVDASYKELLANCGGQSWSTEKSFASPLGYGGKTDLHSAEWIVDVKTKDGDLSKVELYDEHLMQLAAYRDGLGIQTARGGILFVSRDQPKAVFVEASQEDLARGWRMFECLLVYWQAKNRI